MYEPDPEKIPDEAVYCLRVWGHLTTRWSDWFNGLTITPQPDGTTILVGPLVDQPALYGIISRLRDLGLTLLSVQRMDTRCNLVDVVRCSSEKVKGTMSTPVRDPDALIAQYGDGPGQLAAALIGISDSQLDLRKHADSWTIRETIHHLVDGDDLWSVFIKRALGNPHGEYAFDWYWQIPQDEWARRWHYQERPIAPSLALFRANRDHIVQLLSYTPGALEQSLRVRWPTALGEQVVTVALVVEGQTQHVLAHIGDIRDIRAAHGI